MRMVPETLFISEILWSVSLVRSLPAISTLKISDVILTARQIANMMIRSLKLYSLANAVAVPSQNRNTFGLSVLSKNPDVNILATSLRVNLISVPSGFCNLIFLKPGAV